MNNFGVRFILACTSVVRIWHIVFGIIIQCYIFRNLIYNKVNLGIYFSRNRGVLILICSSTTASLKGTATKFWIGLRRPNGGGRHELYWSHTGLPPTFTNWEQYQPKEGTDAQDCGMVNLVTGGTWLDHDCNNNMLFFCEL